MKKFVNKLAVVLSSRWFFCGVIAFFVFEGLWIACSALYPMAFDEDFHYGLIKLYSHVWLPFISQQPPGADVFGAITRDPSYLYHYLASFPDRLLGLITENQAAHVMLLRLINVALFAWAVVLFRKILLRAGISPALTHTALALFALIPIVPLMAGQVGYDPLFILSVAGTCLLVFRCLQEFKKRVVSIRTLSMLTVLCVLASLVKYAFLPIFVATIAYVGFKLWQTFKGRGAQLRNSIVRDYHTLSRKTVLALATLVVISIGLFAQRYAVNIVVYHTPLSDCGQVLSDERCKAYGPWARNYRMAHDKGVVPPAPLAYTWHWVQALHFRSFFMINGPTHNYSSYSPMPLPSAAAIAILVSGILACVLYAKRLFKDRPFLCFLLCMPLFYCLVLWVNNYSDYLATGEPVAINGRYLMPVILLLAAVLGRGFSIALRNWPATKTMLAGLAVVLFLQGGGVSSFILRSDSNWYWPQTTVVHVNNGARKVLSPVIYENSKFY